MSQKAIRLQIDMLYHVDEKLAEDCYLRDIEHFQEMAKAFNEWALQSQEPRQPINFDFRHHLGEVVDETPDSSEEE